MRLDRDNFFLFVVFLTAFFKAPRERKTVSSALAKNVPKYVIEKKNARDRSTRLGGVFPRFPRNRRNRAELRRVTRRCVRREHVQPVRGGSNICGERRRR